MYIYILNVIFNNMNIINIFLLFKKKKKKIFFILINYIKF